MHIGELVSYFFGGMFLTNAIPHLVAGVQGKAFQSPFAKPPGVGLSTSVVNVLWAFANLTFAYLLLVKVGAFDLHDSVHACVAASGGLFIALVLANHFGALHGGKSTT